MICGPSCQEDPTMMLGVLISMAMVIESALCTMLRARNDSPEVLGDHKRGASQSLTKMVQLAHGRGAYTTKVRQHDVRGAWCDQKLMVTQT